MNFGTKLFMVALRIVIGWHLFYEGYSKIMTYAPGSTKKPWTSEMYLRNASGPLKAYFREIVSDFHGLDQLDLARVRAGWDRMVNEATAQFSYTSEQKLQVDKSLADYKERLRLYVESDPSQDPVGETFPKKLEQYRARVAKWQAAEGRDLSAFEKTRQRAEQTELYGKQLELTKPITDLTESLQQELLTLAGKAGAGESGMTEWDRFFNLPRLSELERTDFITRWVLCLAGMGLMLGLFTRLSALAAAFLLGLFYITAPPWPGEPVPPNAEGTYLIVNKNLIELIACLMLACSPAGVWGGVDSLIRGLVTRPLFGVGKEEVLEAAERD